MTQTQPKKEVKGKTVTPRQYIVYVMDQMGFTQADLMRGGCGTRSHVSEMVRGKRRLTINFIKTFLLMTHREKMAYMLIYGELPQ